MSSTILLATEMFLDRILCRTNDTMISAQRFQTIDTFLHNQFSKLFKIHSRNIVSWWHIFGCTQHQFFNSFVHNTFDINITIRANDIIVKVISLPNNAPIKAPEIKMTNALSIIFLAGNFLCTTEIPNCILTGIIPYLPPYRVNPTSIIPYRVNAPKKSVMVDYRP